MTLQFNSDNNLRISDAFRESLTEMIESDLGRFSEHITRIEVHLSDENGGKAGDNDKRCLMEVRMEGRQPLAVTNLANNHEQAVSGAIDKLKAALDTIIGRSRNH
jgi:ribosome-associated translation inhibitor RaiA